MARETSAPKSDTMTVSGQRRPTARKRAAPKPAEEEREEALTQALAVPESSDDGLPLSKEEGDDDELHPLPDSASGFRCGPFGRRSCCSPADYPRPLSPSYSYPCRDILELLLSPVFSPVLSAPALQ